MKQESLPQFTRPSVPSFQFVCSVRWDDMHPRSDDGVKHCSACERTIHLCRTVAEFDEHASAGHCVAVYEEGCFANISAVAPEWDPFKDELIPPSDKPRPPEPPSFLDRPPRFMPTAGVPRMPEPQVVPPPPPPPLPK